MSVELPYFQFYVKDFAGDGKVEAMSTEAVGAYILLLCKAWHETPPGSIPNDDAVLARWSRLELHRWAECRTAVLSCFTLSRSDNRLHQKRMQAEFRKMCQASKLRAKAGKAGADARWQTHSKRIANGCHAGMGIESESPEGGVGETPPHLRLALELWPRWTPTDAQVSEWETALTGRDVPSVEKALRAHIRKSPYPSPTLSEVLKLMPAPTVYAAPSVTNGHVPTGQEKRELMAAGRKSKVAP